MVRRRGLRLEMARLTQCEHCYSEAKSRNKAPTASNYSESDATMNLILGSSIISTSFTLAAFWFFAAFV